MIIHVSREFLPEATRCLFSVPFTYGTPTADACNIDNIVLAHLDVAHAQGRRDSDPSLFVRRGHPMRQVAGIGTIVL